MQVNTICAEAFVYPTEDEEKVLKALRNIIDVEPTRTKATTEFGGKMMILQVCTSDANKVNEILERLSEIVNLDECVNSEGNFGLSLDKQRAFLGQIALGKGIRIRSKIIPTLEVSEQDENPGC